MIKKKAGKKQEAQKELKDKIISELERLERPLAWLVRKTAIPYGTLYSSLVQRVSSISDSQIEKIKAVLWPKSGKK